MGSPLTTIYAMDYAARATRSQALLDSMHQVLDLERDVSEAITTVDGAHVMVSLTPVAFIPGTIVGKNVLVGLGDNFYVERTPRRAQEILQRRIEGKIFLRSTAPDEIMCHHQKIEM